MFQKFSDALKHIVKWKVTIVVHLKIIPSLTNYLDDFLFVVILQFICNQMVHTFRQICAEINCPMSEDKTKCTSQLIIFLGILLNGKLLTLSIP